MADAQEQSFTVKASEQEYKYTVATNWTDFWANRSKWMGAGEQQQQQPDQVSRATLPMSVQGKIVSAQSKVGGGSAFLVEGSPIPAAGDNSFTSNLRGASQYAPPSFNLDGKEQSGMTLDEMVSGTREAALAAGADSRKSRALELGEESEKIEKTITEVLTPKVDVRVPLGGVFVQIPKEVGGVIASQIGGLTGSLYKETQKPYLKAYEIGSPKEYAPISKGELREAREETFFTGLTFAAFEGGARVLGAKPMSIKISAGTAQAFDAPSPAKVYARFNTGQPTPKYLIDLKGIDRIPAPEGGEGAFIMGKKGSRGYTIQEGFVSVEVPKVGRIAELPAQSRIASVSKSVPTPKGFISAGQSRYVGEIRVYDVAGKDAGVEFSSGRVYTPFKVKGQSLSLMKKGSAEIGGDGASIKYPTITEGKPSYYEYRYTQPAERGIGIDRGVKGEIAKIEGATKTTFKNMNVEGTSFTGKDMSLMTSSKPLTIKGTRLSGSIGGKIDITVFSRGDFPPPEYFPLGAPKAEPKIPFKMEVPKFPKVSAPEVSLSQRPKPDSLYVPNKRNAESIFGEGRTDFDFLKKYERAKAPDVKYDVGAYDKPFGGGRVPSDAKIVGGKGGEVQIQIPKPPQKVYAGGNFVPPDITPQVFKLPTGEIGLRIPLISPKTFIKGFESVSNKGATRTRESIGAKDAVKVPQVEMPRQFITPREIQVPRQKQITDIGFTYKGFTFGGGIFDTGGGGGGGDVDIKIPKSRVPVYGGLPIGGGGGGGEGGSKTKGVKGNLRDILTVSRDVERNIAKNLKGLK